MMVVLSRSYFVRYLAIKMGYVNLVATFMLQGIRLSHCFTVNISGETYIEPGVPYTVTCTVSEFLENRRTIYSATISRDDATDFVIVDLNTAACVYRTVAGFPLCHSSICSCDTDGLATHWTYNTPTDLSSSVTFICTSKNNEGSLTGSDRWIPTVPNGPGSNISFNPADESITKNMSGSVGPIVCSAQCNPPCQFHWIKPDRTVVDGSTLEIPSLSRNDHGTFICHAGNGYGSNATHNLILTVNYGPEYVILSPSTTVYTVTEDDTIPSISCTTSCRPQCTLMWTGPNVPDGTTNDLFLQNINRNQAGRFNCTATNEVGSKVSSNVKVDVKYGPGSSVSFTPADESIAKVVGQSLGPIVCFAQCNPPCQFHWIKPDGTVINGSNLTTPSLSKNEHGTFTCHTGNGYGNNATKNLNVTVNYGPGSSISFNPADESITKVLGQSLGPIICSAQCNPSCQFYWIKPDGSVVDGSNLAIPSLSKNDHGTFTCHTGNGYGNNVTKNILLTVNYGPGSSIAFNPADESITKELGQSLGPIVCSAQCNPPCQFHWIKPDGSVVDGSNLTIPSLSKNDHGTFTCHTGNGNNVTKDLLLTVNFGPESVTLSPPNTTYAVTEGDTMPSISCTASCRSQCTFMWTGPNVPNGTTNDLYLQNINRNQKGTFYCIATNKVGNKMSSNVEVDVKYQAKVENVAINTTNTVDENTTVMFSCLLEGNPTPTVTWSLNGKILQTTEGSTTKSSFIVDSVRCNNTGRYICTASNIIGNSTKQLMLYVTCHPRNAIILDTTIAIKNKNVTLNITVPIMSYPQPTLIRWTFMQKGTTDLIDVDNKYITTTYGVYQHVSQLIKYGLIDSEYGTYSINASNNIEPYFQHDFKVVAETIPDPPSHVSAVCDTSPFSTIISWRSEFDGGRAQTFHVWFEICCENVHEFVAYSNEKSDPGRNNYVSVEITSLQAATPYIFYVSSSNDYGSSKSTNVFCNTTTEQFKKNELSASNVLFAAGISSLIIGLLATVFAIAFVVICRHRLRIQKREQMRTNNYTEFTTCTHCNPVLTDSYDSINTTAIGPVVINKTQTDRNVDTYEECLPVTNTDHTYNNLNKQPKEKKKLKKKEAIYDNMKI